MEFMNVAETAEKWGIDPRMVRGYCKDGRVPGAVQNDDNWLVPLSAIKPPRKKREEKPRKVTEIPPLAAKLKLEKKKRNYHGLYDYTQANFTYSSNRLASNRLMCKQVDEIMKTGKVTTYSEPVKIDDLIEITNHVICIDYILETVMQPIKEEKLPCWIVGCALLSCYPGPECILQTHLGGQWRLAEPSLCLSQDLWGLGPGNKIFKFLS